MTIHHVAWALTEAAKAKIEAEVLGRAVDRARERALVTRRRPEASGVDFVEITDPGLMRDIDGAEARGYAAVAERSAFHAGGDGIELVPEDIVVTASVYVRFQTR